ncbi:hypothetical protein E2C01_043191 [Portunus trituberculatus]|uniref:Uncharacterized protein n=1 Tax=Portunus trituberculatus TaxID=210409 RepID=A0A5B7FSA0_PORTR|nr:hypothetical protein [Portunus trituberculatus]
MYKNTVYLCRLGWFWKSQAESRRVGEMANQSQNDARKGNADKEATRNSPQRNYGGHSKSFLELGEQRRRPVVTGGCGPLEARPLASSEMYDVVRHAAILVRTRRGAASNRRTKSERIFVIAVPA